jgi:hypothetical protein
VNDRSLGHAVNVTFDAIFARFDDAYKTSTVGNLLKLCYAENLVVLLIMFES